MERVIAYSADSDLTGPVQTVRPPLASKRIPVAFPPERSSFALKSAAKGVTYVGRDALLGSAFPARLRRANGVVLQRPLEWR